MINGRDYENFFLKKPKARTVQNCVWHPPCDNVLKINVDGCFNPGGRSSGWHSIIWDSLGRHSWSCCREAALSSVSFTSRGWSMLCSYSVWTGVGNVTDHHWNRCSGIGASVDIRGLWSILKWSFFREIKAFAALNFSVFSVICVARICNKVVDALAAFGSKIDTEPQAVSPGGCSYLRLGLDCWRPRWLMESLVPCQKIYK